MQGEPGAPGNKGDAGAKGEPVSAPAAQPTCLETPRGRFGEERERLVLEARLQPALELASGRAPTTGCPLFSALSRAPLVFKDPLALLEKKESEEPEVNPALPACLDPLASV